LAHYLQGGTKGTQDTQAKTPRQFVDPEYFCLHCIEAMRKTMRKSTKSRKTRQMRAKKGGGHRLFFGKVTDGSGNEYDDVDFNEAGWQEINNSLRTHVLKYYKGSLILHDGFGGDDGTGRVAINFKGTLKPMKFTVSGKRYTMSFDQFWDEE